MSNPDLTCIAIKTISYYHHLYAGKFIIFSPSLRRYRYRNSDTFQSTSVTYSELRLPLSTPSPLGEGTSINSPHFKALWIDNSNIKALVKFADNTTDSVVAGSLSNKEREIVIFISQGHTNKEIGSQLFISEQTVKAHINSIFKKLNLSRRTQLVPLGIKLRADSLPKPLTPHQ